MWQNIDDRVRAYAEYMVETRCTVRACAAHFGGSKSTVHKDVTERLARLDGALCEQVKKVLACNLQERHLRGGDATRRKYEHKKR